MTKPGFHLKGGSLIPSLGVIFSIYLILQSTIEEIFVGSALLTVGVLIYTKYFLKKELTELR